jgi:uncharacterized protein YggE
MKTLPIATLLLVLTTSTLAAQQPPNVDTPKITVGGESLVYARPDRIVLSFGIETRDNQLIAAKEKNAAIWKKAAAALKQSGVPNKDVQTDYLSIEPRYRNYNEIDEPIGYLARNMFVVTISDPAKVEGLISEMLTLGVNHVNGVEFQTTEFKRHRESARDLALAAAKEKAEKMAAVLGCSVGEPLAINESYGGGSWYFSSWNGWGYGRSSGGMLQNVVQDQRGAGGEEPQDMALGKISIRAGVSVTFALKHGRGEAARP